MEKNQRIRCNVSSCKYNNEISELCELEEIKVAACKGCNNGKAEDESMCDSYRNKYKLK